MNKQQKIEMVNAQLEGAFTLDEAMDRFIYLTNKNRGRYTTVRHLENSILNGRLGELLYRLDSVAFNVMINDLER